MAPVERAKLPHLSVRVMWKSIFPTRSPWLTSTLSFMLKTSGDASLPTLLCSYTSQHSPRIWALLVWLAALLPQPISAFCLVCTLLANAPRSIQSTHSAVSSLCSSSAYSVVSLVSPAYWLRIQFLAHCYPELSCICIFLLFFINSLHTCEPLRLMVCHPPKRRWVQVTPS